jgi:predicted ATP-binding protein involved in virulence/transcriptional regulator with GAF, ATPase, and Fis domain
MSTLTQLKEKDILKKSSDLQCDLIGQLAITEEVINQFKKQIENISCFDDENLKVIFDNINKELYREESQQLLGRKRSVLTKFLLSDPSREDLRHEDWSIQLTKRISDIILTDLMHKITEIVKETLHASECSIYLKTNKEDKFGRTLAELIAGRGYGPNSYPLLPLHEVKDSDLSESDILGITGWVISKGRSFLSNNIDEIVSHPHHFPPDIPDNKKLASMLAVPVSTTRGEIIGVIKAEGIDSMIQFKVVHQMFLETISLVVGRCVVHKNDFIEGKTNTAISGWVLDVISEALAFEEELDNFLDIVARVISCASRSDSCAIFLIDNDKRTLTQRAGSGNMVLKKTIRSYILPNNKLESDIKKIKNILPDSERVGLTPWIANTGKYFYAANFKKLSEHSYHKGKFDEVNYDTGNICGAWFGVPLKVGSETKGVLKIENESRIKEPDAREFNEEIQVRVDILAQNVALSIERFMLRRIERNRIFQKVEVVIFEILKSHSGIKDIVKKVVESTMEILNAKTCALFLKEGNQLIQPEWAAKGWAEKGPKIRIYNLVDQNKIIDSDRVGLTVWIAANQEKFTAKSNLELTMHPHHKGTFDQYNFPQGQKCEAFMGYPLLIGKELIGVLKVETKMRDAADNKEEFTYFSEQDELVFDFIANSVAIGIYNARKVELEILNYNLNLSKTKDDVIEELFNFCQNRQAAITTLSNAAETFKDNDVKGKSILNFIAILNPEFDIKQFIELMKDVGKDLKFWFEFIYKAILVTNKDELIALNNAGTKLNSLMSYNFFLFTSIKVILTTREELLNALTFERKPNVETLKECNRIINLKINEIEDNLFTKSILIRVFTQWKSIIEKTLTQRVTINKIKLNNLDFFGDLTWTLGPHMNILLGRNGYGKTNLLQLMASLLQDISFVREKYLNENKNNPNIELLINIDKTEKKLSPVIKSPEIVENLINTETEEQYEKIPILAISDTRFINKSKTTLSYLGEDEKEIGLRKTGADHFIRQKPFEAVIQNFLYQLCIEFYNNNKSFNSPKIKLLESVIKTLTDNTFQFINVESLGQGILKLEVNTEGSGLKLPIQQASQGTLSILSIFGLIYEFLQSLYPESSEKKIQEEHAIVFIDEIDAHLHPNWQQKIIGLLRKTFPNIQFIVTAHSPLVVAGCYENEIAVLRKGTSGYIVENIPEDFMGITTADIYKKVFDVEDIDESYLYYSTLRGLKSLKVQRIVELKSKTTLSDIELVEMDNLQKLIYKIEIVEQKEKMKLLNDPDINIAKLETENRLLKNLLPNNQLKKK